VIRSWTATGFAPSRYRAGDCVDSIHPPCARFEWAGRVARRSKLDTVFVRELMQAMGRSNLTPRERAFSDDDLEIARVVRKFLDAGLPRSELFEAARMLSLRSPRR
jgi:hypothetical protein